MKALLNRNGSYYIIAPGEDGIYVLSGRFVGLPVSCQESHQEKNHQEKINNKFF